MGRTRDCWYSHICSFYPEKHIPSQKIPTDLCSCLIDQNRVIWQHAVAKKAGKSVVSISSLFSTHVPNHAPSDAAGTNTPPWLQKVGGAQISTSLIQGLVSTYDELRARLGPQGRHLPRPCSTFHSLDCIPNRKS